MTVDQMELRLKCSVSGVLVMIGHTPAVFKSKFQRTDELNSVEAAYMALSLCTQEVWWSCVMLKDMRHEQREGTQDGTVKIGYIDIKHQLADILTNALGTTTLQYLRNVSGVKAKVTEQ
ncbi:hypothetical protein PHMEG_0004225 [Phytophthora megakarya]|uniref:Uncharacterized protein n=1 Tax=Phytophthora megakarya TaxID=4795 RepID=A0A225WUD4_9STRA|nr:hypothetical protein PHMEG_0004225 [Phytophthora megakarya]